MVEISEYVQKSIVMMEEVGDFGLQVWYTSKHEYEIRVTQKSTGNFKTSFKSATYEPIYGIDIADMQMILAEAEALCEGFENGDN